MKAAAAGFADADLLGHRRVRGKLELGQDPGEINTRAIFWREDIDLETERSKARFYPKMTRRQSAVACPLVSPLGFLRRYHKGRMTGRFELARNLVGDLVHFPQHQHVDVLDRRVG